ncbi:MAG: HAMP domain-containing histidine kinase [Eubacteriaceae bacterium]|jgi:signal transduction histidine kinase|nr:HAMP domain-containing histidine kinase [Eubacteriaceae bacterium]
MMRSLAVKMVLAFSAILIFFSIVIGTAFNYLFTKHTANIQFAQIQEQGMAIAGIVSNYLETPGQLPEHNAHEGNKGHGNGQNGMGQGVQKLLTTLEAMTTGEIWIVDDQAKSITFGHHGEMLSYGELPEGAEKMIRKVFAGEITTGEAFNPLMPEENITLGVPVYNQTGDAIVAGVLLHTPVKGMEQASREGNNILRISLAVAFGLSVVITLFLVSRLTKPLKRMEETAKTLTAGDYSARTGIVQKDEIGSLAKSLDVFAERLEQAEKESRDQEQARRDFISGISHELRTPVTVMRASLESLIDGVITDPAQVEANYRQLNEEGKQLERLVNDLLELTRLQNPGFALNLETIDFQQVLSDNVRMAKAIARDKEIRITKNAPEGEVLLLGDYGRLRQLVAILLDNAIKYSDAGSEVILNLTIEAKEMVLKVIDHGVGIAIEDAEKIFDRFFHKGGGTGLGLPIAREIATRHQGTLSCQSTPGVGSTFQLTLPVLRETRQEE